jgi:hypothetical protein
VHSSFKSVSTVLFLDLKLPAPLHPLPVHAHHPERWPVYTVSPLHPGTLVLEMSTSTRTASLRDLGIVGMEQALQDGAAGSAEGATRHGIGSHNLTELRDHFWCTLCRKCLKRRQAYNHRNSHGLEWGELQDPTMVQAIQLKLDQQYGNALP